MRNFFLNSIPGIVFSCLFVSVSAFVLSNSLLMFFFRESGN